MPRGDYRRIQTEPVGWRMDPSVPMTPADFFSGEDQELVRILWRLTGPDDCEKLKFALGDMLKAYDQPFEIVDFTRGDIEKMRFLTLGFFLGRRSADVGVDKVARGIGSEVEPTKPGNRLKRLRKRHEE